MQSRSLNVPRLSPDYVTYEGSTLPSNSKVAKVLAHYSHDINADFLILHQKFSPSIYRTQRTRHTPKLQETAINSRKDGKPPPIVRAWRLHLFSILHLATLLTTATIGSRSRSPQRTFQALRQLDDQNSLTYMTSQRLRRRRANISSRYAPPNPPTRCARACPPQISKQPAFLP